MACSPKSPDTLWPLSYQGLLTGTLKVKCSILNGQAALYPADQLRFLHVRDHQPVLCSCHGYINKGYEVLPRFLCRVEMIDTNQIDQVKIQAFGAVNADEGYPVRGDVIHLL